MANIRTVVVVSLLVILLDAARDYSDHKIITALPKNEKALQFLRYLEVHENDDNMDFLNRPLGVNKGVNIKVHGSFVDSVKQRFSKHGIDVSVTVDNIQSLIQAEKEENNVELDQLSSERFNLTTYNSFDQIIAFLKESCDDAPEDVNCEMVLVGKTYEGRELMALKISMESDVMETDDDDDDDDENQQPIMYIEAGIHAREWIAPASTVYFLNKLFNDDRLRNQILSRYELYVIPSANPDGYTYSREHDRFWRKTRSVNFNSSCFGTDPNRNFDVLWSGPGSSSNPCSNVYQGSKVFSEVETRSMADLMLSFKGRMRIYVAVHSYSQMWLVPYAYTKAIPKNYNDMFDVAKEVSIAQTKASGYKYTYGQTSRMLYVCAGGSDDWALDSGKASYSYTVELPDRGQRGFELPSSQIARVGNSLAVAFEQLVKSVEKIQIREQMQNN